MKLELHYQVILNPRVAFPSSFLTVRRYLVIPLLHRFPYVLLFKMVMSIAKSRKLEPKTPQACEVRAVPGPEPLIDAKARIHDPFYPFRVSHVRPELFERHLKGQDRFRVVELGLYYQIASTTFPVPEFISWLSEAYDERR